jgi:hypothetical protein
MNNIPKLQTHNFNKCGDLLILKTIPLSLIFFYLPSDNYDFNNYNNYKWSFPVYGVDLIQNNKLYNLSNRFPFSINEPMMVLYKYGNPCSLINYKGMDIKNLNNYILNLNSCSFNNFTCN